MKTLRFGWLLAASSLLLCAPSVFCQVRTEESLKSEMFQTPSKMTGYFYNYTAPSGNGTSVPSGYRPFYLSHYGRHGARRTHQERFFTSVMSELENARESDGLTELGESVYARLKIVYNEGKGRFGELTQLGMEQHSDIAHRMVERYPQIFRRKDVEVRAVSSTVRRCVMSMAASVSELRAMNPSINLKMETGERYMEYLAYDSAEWYEFNSDTTTWQALLKDFEKEVISPDRVLGSLFVYPDAIDDPLDFVISLRWICSHMQAIDAGVDLDDIFTNEELYEIWKTVDYKYYTLYSSNPDNKMIPRKDACRLLLEILQSADAALNQIHPSADLRYGHDVYIMKLMSLLRAEGFAEAENDPHKSYLVWQDFRITPMAANVQMVFYRNRKGDVIVKVLLNEREVKLPIQEENGPYYSWSAFKAYCLELLLSLQS